MSDFYQERAAVIRQRATIVALSVALLWGLAFFVIDEAIFGTRYRALPVRAAQWAACVAMALALRRADYRRGQIIVVIGWLVCAIAPALQILDSPSRTVDVKWTSTCVVMMAVASVAELSWRSAAVLAVTSTTALLACVSIRFGFFDWVNLVYPLPWAVIILALRDRDAVLRDAFASRRALADAHARLRDEEEARSRLFVGLSHDFRTPLTMISGLAEEIARTPAMAPSAQRIVRHAHGMVDLVEQLLELARLDAGRAPRNVVSFDIVALAREVAALLAPSTADRVVRVTAAEPAQTVAADPAHVRRILINLVANALKQPAVKRLTLALAADADAVVVDVVDDGPGVPPALRARLFERFATSDGASASGIGLPLARELARINDGELILVDDAAQTTFRLRLPRGTRTAVALPAVPRLPAQTPIAIPMRRRAEGPSLLLVEDNAELAELIARTVAEDFCVVHEATVAGAVAALSAAPAIVLCDVMLPDGDGFAVLDRLRRHPALDATPFVFLSAMGDVTTRVRGIAAGADDYLVKPFSADELRHRLTRAAARAEARRRALAAQRSDLLMEIHDGVSASLSRAAILLHSRRHTVEERTRDALAAIHDGLREARALMAIGSAGAVAWPDLVAELRRELGEGCEQAGLAFDFSAVADDALAHLSPACAHTVRRIAREALTNTIKHAEARAFTCAVAVTDGSVRLRISDDGKGLGDGAPLGRGMGIVRRRAEALGGSAAISRRDDGPGTIVEAALPAQPASP